MKMTLAFVLWITTAFAAGELSNRRAPGFSLPDSKAVLHDLADYRGKVVLVDFMQVGCPHCAKFSAILEQVKAKYGARVAILSVVNPPSDMKGVQQYIAAQRVTTPILMDCGQAAYSDLLPKTGSVNIPHLFLIDGEGMIRNDMGYSEASKPIFEGDALFAEVEKLFGPAPKKKK